MLGYSPQQLTELTDNKLQPVSQLIHPDDLQDVISTLQQHIRGDSDIYRVEYRMKTASGQWKWILSIGRSVSDQPNRLNGLSANRVFGINLDISDSKALEAALLEAKHKAEQATKAKSDFLSNMSHEIRTPMNAIIGMSHLALQTDLNRKQRNYIDKVHRSAEALLGIINDILDFSKIEAGKMELESINFRLEDVLDNLVNMVGLKAAEKGVELHFNLAPDVPVALIGDPLRLGQILVNLCNNAIKFTEQRGEIEVSISCAEHTDSGVRLHIAVRDTGIGMSSEQQQRLFQSFSQADSSTTRKYGGTGLGLAICKNLTELMGGQISVTSQPGSGSTFMFDIQLGLQRDAAPKRLPITPGSQPLRVLVVDDNATAREILSGILHQFDMLVDIAHSGAEALQLLQQNDSSTHPVDVVLMDWQMPDLDGVETTRQLQQLPLRHQPAVIIVTAFGDDSLEQQAAELDVRGFLAKPVTMSGLFDAMMNALGMAQVRSSHTAQRQKLTQQTLAKLAGAQVLLVEDNEMNQELALELLSSNGINATVANHGQEALQWLSQRQFDGILMDCQMPVMDGYAATAAIRAMPEYKTLPIIAMTANAMAGDREKALQAGMNDHIAKPIDVAAMFNTMAKWIVPAQPALLSHAKEPQAPSMSIPQLPGINVERGLATTQHNHKLYRKLLRRFWQQYRHFEQEFSQAQTDADSSAAARYAHTLKGTAGNIGAQQLQQLAATLEQLCLTQQDVTQIAQQVQTELNLLLPALAELAASETEPVAAVTAAPNKHQIKALLSQLQQLVEEFDTSATDVADQLQHLLQSSAQRADIGRLQQAIGAYDFEQAAQLLAQIKQRLE